MLALDDKEGTTACSDGSCILWDLQTYKRKCILAAGSSIADACYSSDHSQLVTAGVDPGPCKASRKRLTAVTGHSTSHGRLVSTFSLYEIER